ncbi:MAG: CoA-binding protein [Desulfuromonadaceae bacterium]|nr:CoA-binding protein [Desulfuromonadaceae bacterium]MDF1579990.1 CoA-binding protein [Desulfuromonadales bacterium]
MTTEERISKFFSAEAFAVAGASANRGKFGNKVLRCYQQHQLPVTPINPTADAIEGLRCVAHIDQLPANVKSLSIITPPAITIQLIPQAAAHGIENIWLQPGAQSPAAIAAAEKLGLNVIADGSCLLVVLGYHDH